MKKDDRALAKVERLPRWSRLPRLGDRISDDAALEAMIERLYKERKTALAEALDEAFRQATQAGTSDDIDELLGRLNRMTDEFRNL